MKKINLLTIYGLLAFLSFACKKSDEVTPETYQTEESTDEESSNDDSTDDDTEQLSIQARLTNEETPFEIYTSDNSLLDSLYGKTYEGGLIAYLNTSTGTGFVATPTDINSELTIWGCANTTLLQQYVVFYDPANGLPVYGYLALAIEQNIGSGKTNTETIVDNCTISAALFCQQSTVSGYDDWYMPNTNEMIEVSKSLSNSNTLATEYWTSTQEDVTVNAKVYTVSTSDHAATLNAKTSIDGLGLRAIRDF